MRKTYILVFFRSEGKNPYVILRGGSTFKAMFAYISAFEEMIQQVIKGNASFEEMIQQVMKRYTSFKK